MGVKVHLCHLTAKVKRALLRLSRQCRLNRHLVKTPQPRAATQESAVIADSDTELLDN